MLRLGFTSFLLVFRTSWENCQCIMYKMFIYDHYCILTGVFVVRCFHTDSKFLNSFLLKRNCCNFYPRHYTRVWDGFPREKYPARARILPLAQGWSQRLVFFAFMVTFFNFISRRFSLISTTRPTGAERIKNKQLFYTSRIARYGFSFLQCPGDGVSVVKQFYERKISSDFIFIIAGL